jgi:hypothetical protein
VARKVIQHSERVLKVPLQKYLTTMILSPITSNSELHAQCYALVYEVSRNSCSLLLLLAEANSARGLVAMAKL